MAKQLTYGEVIDDFIKHYVDHPENLAHVGGDCVMLTSDGRRCAFSRWVMDDHPSVKEGLSDMSSVMINKYGNKMLKPEVRHLDEEFWMTLQIEHDSMCEHVDNLELGRLNKWRERDAK